MNTALYVRVSTLDQRTDSQEMELKKYCRQRGWKDFVFYVDRISGAKASGPHLDRLMQDIRAGKIERLVVYRLDQAYPSLRFDFIRLYPGVRSCVVEYRSVNGLLSAELMEFDAQGKVRRVLAHYSDGAS